MRISRELSGRRRLAAQFHGLHHARRLRSRRLRHERDQPREQLSQNHRDLRSWEATLDSGCLPVWRGLSLSHDKEVRADVIQRVMCQGIVDFDDVGESPRYRIRSVLRGCAGESRAPGDRRSALDRQTEHPHNSPRALSAAVRCNVLRSLNCAFARRRSSFPDHLSSLQAADPNFYLSLPGRPAQADRHRRRRAGGHRIARAEPRAPHAPLKPFA